MSHRFIALCLSLALAACATTPNTSTTVEPSNSTATPTANTSQETARRVVALSSLSADIIQRLDASKLVGIPGSELFKDDARFAGLPVVTAGRTPPNLEQIVNLEPDLVVGAAGFHDQALRRLNELGIKTLATEVNDWRSLTQLTQTLAQAIGADPQPLINRYQTFLNNPPEKPVSTLVLVSRQPILAPNKNSWAGDLLTRFNAQNVVADLQGDSPIDGYVTLSAEKVLETNPQRIILVETSDGILEQFKAQPFWKDLQAVTGDRVYVMEYYGLVNPGSIDKIEQACARLRAALSSN